MNCRLFQRLMYLNEDELSENERVDFFRHRSSCPQCAAEFARTEKSRRVIRRLAATVPELSDPHDVALNILKSVTADMKSKRRVRGGSLFDAVVDRLVLPRVRAGMALLLLVAGISFILESTSGFFRIKQFEERITIANVRRPATAGIAIGHEQLMEGVFDLTRMVSGKQYHTALGGDLVVIRKSSLQSLMLLYHELNVNALRIPPEFHQAYPELSKLLSREASSTRFEELLKEREALIRELNSLISIERKTP